MIILELASVKRYFNKNKLDIIFILIYIILPFIFFRDTFRLNSVVFGSGDPVFAYIPLQNLTLNLVKAGEFPFWNKYIFCGFPLFANIQTSFLYPIVFIFNLIFKIPLAYNLSVILHYILAGIFMFLFLKNYELNKVSSFVGGLVFMFSGAMISHKSWGPFLYTVIWLPLILFFLEKYRKSKNFIFILLASIFYAFSFFGGLPQYFLYESIIVLFFILFNSFIYGKKGIYFISSISVFILVFLLILVQLIPAYELMQNSFSRGDNSYTFFTLDSFRPQFFPMFFFPFIFGVKHPSESGIPGKIHWFGTGDSVEMIVYFGIITIALLIFAFFYKNKQKYLWIFILILSFILALGQYTPIYKVLYYIPLLNKFRAPARHWFEFSFAFSVLVGFGFNYIYIQTKEKLRKAAFIVLGFFNLIFFGFIIFFSLIKVNRVQIIKGYFNEIAKLDYLIKNIDIRNYAIFMPFIILVVVISLLTLLIFKKNKFIVFGIAVFIFFDLLSMGRFDENNTKNIFNYESKFDIVKLVDVKVDEINNSIRNNIINNNNYTEAINNAKENNLKYNFKDKDDYFRLLPLVVVEDKNLYQPNVNIFYNYDTVSGYDPFVLKSFADFYNLGDKKNYGWIHHTDWKNLLSNNIVISQSNCKYIVVEKPESIENFIYEIGKSLFISDITVTDSNDLNQAEFNNAVIDRENELAVISGKSNYISYIDIPVNLKKNTDYYIGFYLKQLEKLKGNIYFNFVIKDDKGDRQIKPLFYLEPDDLKNEDFLYEKIVKTGDFPEKDNTFLRIFIKNEGKFSIKMLKIYEVKKYYNYDIVGNFKDALVLENKNCLPRFYFASFIKKVNNAREAKENIWEMNSKLDKDKFDVRNTTLVEGVDKDFYSFDNNNSIIELIQYKNNYVVLKTFNKSNSFLVFSDSYYPGWKAYVNNRETKIYKTNGFLKGIFIPSGENIIIFKFIPSNFIFVTLISLFSFLGIIIYILIYVYKRNNIKFYRNHIVEQQ